MNKNFLNWVMKKITKKKGIIPISAAKLEFHLKNAYQKCCSEIFLNLGELDRDSIIKNLISKLKNKNTDICIRESCSESLRAISKYIPESKKEEVVDALLTCFNTKECLARPATPELDDFIYKYNVLVISLSDCEARESYSKALLSLIPHLNESQISPIITSLVNGLSNDSWGIRELCARSLGEMEAYIPDEKISPIVDALLKFGDHKSYTSKFAAIKPIVLLISRLSKSKIISIIENLIDDSNNPDLEIRCFCVSCLGAMSKYIPGSKIIDAIATVEKICRYDEDWNVRVYADTALERLLTSPYIISSNKKS